MRVEESGVGEQRGKGSRESLRQTLKYRQADDGREMRREGNAHVLPFVQPLP